MSAVQSAARNKTGRRGADRAGTVTALVDNRRMSSPAPARRRLDLAAPIAPDPLPRRPVWELLAVGFGVWILPLVNTALLLTILLR